MHDPIAAGRQVALRAVAVQAATVAVVALAFLVAGPAWSLAAALGGGALALGNALAARLALDGIVAARVAFGRLLLGVLAKWAVVVAVFVAALEAWHLPPLPMLAGLAAGMLAWMWAVNAMPGRRAAPGAN